jgi:hypothetical protein
MQCACAMLSSVGSPSLPCVSTLSHKRYNFILKELLDTNCVFWFSLQLLSETFLILKRNERDITINVHESSCEVGIILVIF